MQITDPDAICELLLEHGKILFSVTAKGQSTRAWIRHENARAMGEWLIGVADMFDAWHAGQDPTD